MPNRQAATEMLNARPKSEEQDSAAATVSAIASTPDIAAEQIADAPTSIAPPSDSYGRAMKSSALIGGASLINVILTILRTKVLSVLVGPAGLGLMGMYNSILTMATTIAGLGINSSGVRQIAQAAGTGDADQLTLTVATLRRTALILGTAGAALLAALSGPVCRLAFGDTKHQRAVILLAAAVFCTVVQGAQAALIQGLRRIRDSAKINVLSGVFATIFSIPLVWWLREPGIAPFLLAAAIAGLLAAWWYTRGVPSHRSPSFGAMRVEVSAMVRLGAAILLSAAITTISAFVFRSLIVRQSGLTGVGIYQAGSGIALLYVNFILQAMGLDFFPRLTAAPAIGPERTRIVNEQAEIAMLFALPGILGTFVLAPLVIHAFYSPAFMAATPILKWHLLGMLFRVVGFPLGYLILAWGEALTFSMLEIAFGIVQVSAVWIGLKIWGLNGVGIGFFVLNVFYLPALTIVAMRRYSFHWWRQNIVLWAAAVCFVGIVWIGGNRVMVHGVPVIGLATVAVAGVFCLRRLHRRLGSPPWTQMLSAIRGRRSAVNAA